MGSLLAVAASAYTLGIHTIKTHSRRRMFSATKCLVAEPLVYPMTCPVFCVGGTAGGDRMQLDQLKSPSYALHRPYRQTAYGGRWCVSGCRSFGNQTAGKTRAEHS